MAVLCTSGGAIFNLPYVFEILYVPMQQAMDLSKTQMGVLMGVFGGVSMAAYFPGGCLADRLSPRKLITVAMIATGVGGFYFATFPSYESLLALHAFWGLSISLVFWNAMIKATRDWAPGSEQGRAFGILEAGRGVVEVIPATILVAVFAWLGSTDAALATVIVSYSVLNIALGLATWWILEDPRTSGEPDLQPKKRRDGWAQVMRVLKMPTVWLTAVIIMAANSAYWGTYYFTPYASEVFLMSVAMAGFLSVARMWVKPFTALASGFVADRFGISRTVACCMLLTAISFALFAMTPAKQALLPLVVVNVAIAAAGIFALRGIYWALLNEGGIPVALTGTAAGVASAIGFIPDIYMPLLSGVLLDGYPGPLGYRLLFAGIAAMAAVGVLAAFMIMRLNRRERERVMPAQSVTASRGSQVS
jgi:nitrate/nitrite transporter NarK